MSLRWRIAPSEIDRLTTLEREAFNTVAQQINDERNAP